MKKNSCYFTFMGCLFLFKGRCCWRNVIKWFRCGNNKITGSSANDLLLMQLLKYGRVNRLR
jgi:hypothetical protein